MTEWSNWICRTGNIAGTEPACPKNGRGAGTTGKTLTDFYKQASGVGECPRNDLTERGENNVTLRSHPCGEKAGKESGRSGSYSFRVLKCLSWTAPLWCHMETRSVSEAGRYGNSPSLTLRVTMLRVFSPKWRCQVRNDSKMTTVFPVPLTLPSPQRGEGSGEVIFEPFLRSCRSRP